MKILDLLCEYRNIFDATSSADQNLYKKVQGGIAVNELIKDKVMWKICVYANLQIIIRLHHTLEEIVKLTNAIEKNLSKVLKRDHFEKNARLYEKWKALFEVKKGQRWPICQAIVINQAFFLNKEGTPSVQAWDFLLGRIKKVHEPIK